VFEGDNDLTFNLPIADGTNGQALKTDGAGNLSFGPVATNSTSGTSGAVGVTGSTGTSGTSGVAGTSGQAGTSGTSGNSGSTGVSGSSGTSGEAGTSGTSFFGTTSGTSGITGLSGTSGTTGLAQTPSNISFKSSQSTDLIVSATTTEKMFGLSASFTPTVTGDCLIVIQGSLSPASSTIVFTTSIRLGTGTAPANSATASGTIYGNGMNTQGTISARNPYSIQAVASLTAGVTYWIDLGVVGASGTTTMIFRNSNIFAMQLTETRGTSGSSGTSGLAGTAGTSGNTFGSSGSSGTSGTRGTSGTSGSFPATTVNAYITDSTTITKLTTSGNWTSGVYTGTAITGTNQGQKYYTSSGSYFYEAVADNSWIRIALS
jgi:hypothetical protein